MVKESGLGLGLEPMPPDSQSGPGPGSGERESPWSYLVMPTPFPEVAQGYSEVAASCKLSPGHHSASCAAPSPSGFWGTLAGVATLG